MIEIGEFDDSDAEIITFFPSISTGFIRRPKKKEESVKATQTSLIFYNKN